MFWIHLPYLEADELFPAKSITNEKRISHFSPENNNMKVFANYFLGNFEQILQRLDPSLIVLVCEGHVMFLLSFS